MQTKVTLVDWPRYPIETVFYLWEAARSNTPIPLPEEIHERMKIDPKFNTYVRETFEKVIDSEIPIAENLNFIFLLEGVSISFREQMVRHRIGVKVGERFGVDMFPDIHESTWWAQSMRFIDMGKFSDDRMYRIPESVKVNPGVESVFHYAMNQAQDAYQKLMKAGVPVEDAREVIPLASQHRISWGLNLTALMHICKKRSCWILQLGLWEPIIRGMIKELVTRVDPYFSNLVTPPCIKGDTFKKCVFELDNERRIAREDPLLPCGLFMYQNEIKPEEVKMDQGRFNAMEKSYEDFWQRDTHTGKRISNPVR